MENMSPKDKQILTIYIIGIALALLFLYSGSLGYQLGARLAQRNFVAQI